MMRLQSTLGCALSRLTELEDRLGLLAAFATAETAAPLDDGSPELDHISSHRSAA
jgi:hypothetical protein